MKKPTSPAYHRLESERHDRILLRVSAALVIAGLVVALISLCN